MTVTLRTTANDKATNKGSALSHAELDANFVHFLDNGLTVVGDDSTGTAFTVSDDIKIAGGTNITTAVSGPTLTISGATDITCNSLASSDSTAIQLNDALNVSGAITGGSTLTVDGASTLTGNVTASGTLGVTGASTLDGITVTDNKITTNASNSNLELSANGTGLIVLSPMGATKAILDNAQTGYNAGAKLDHGTQLIYSNQTLAADGMSSDGDKIYANPRISAIKLDGTNSSSSAARFRQANISMLDLNGSELTSTSASAGLSSFYAENEIRNTDSSLGRIGQVKNIHATGYISQTTGNVTVDNYTGAFAELWIGADSGDTCLISDVKGFHYGGASTDGSGGTKTITKETAFYGQFGAGATKYLLDTSSDQSLSNVGTLIKYKEKIVALVDDSGAAIAVDCDDAPVFTYTVQTAQDLVITDLEEGKTVTIILRQDSGDSTVPNITFVGDDSVAVKFPGGAPTLTTETGAIDVVTIFNDGTDLLGNIVQDFK